MTILRRPQPTSDLVDVSARLAGYEVTRTEGLDRAYVSGYGDVMSARRTTTAQIVAPSDVLEDRRASPRFALRLPVRATPQADEPWQDGMTIDASLTGLCVEMGTRPSPGYYDVEIEAGETLAAWSRVVAWTPLDDGRFRWRLRLVSYDPGYPVLLEGLVPIVTGVAPPADEPELAPEGTDLVGAGLGWGPLLDNPSPKRRKQLRAQGA